MISKRKVNSKRSNAIFSQYSTARSCQSAELKNILQNVKYLQNCVNNIPIYAQEDRRYRLMQTNPKNMTNRHKSNSNRKNQMNFSRQQNRQISVNTIRKCSSILRNGSKSLKNVSKTLDFYKQPFQQSKAVENNINCQTNALLQVPSNQLSLQIQNLKLQKKNLYLQKQLLEQQILMEKREKQLLKCRLKRIKVYNTEKKYQSNFLNKCEIKPPNIPISQFDVCPPTIKIPFVSVQQANSKQARKLNQLQIKIDQNNRHIYSSIYNEANEQVDSLLLSETSDRRETKKNCQNESILQKQFWKLLGSCRKQEQKRQVRQALGDIANRLKVLRQK